MDNSNQILNQAFTGLTLQDNSNAERVASLLDQFDLRWSVAKEPLYLSDGTMTQYKAVVRQDNRNVFQTVKDSYTPFQNSELAELLIRISEKGGYGIHTGGMFKGGGKVFVQLVSGNLIKGIGINDDIVKGFTTGINSHDGSRALRWGSTNITISCQNTFNMAASELENSIRHTSNLQSKVDIYLREIDSLVVQEKSLFDRFIKLSEVPVKQSNIVKVVREITGVDIELDEASAKDKYSGYSINRSTELLECIANEIEQKGQTLWGLFSGVTNYTTHIIPVSKTDNARLESKYIGTGNMLDNKAFTMISNISNN